MNYFKLITRTLSILLISLLPFSLQAKLNLSKEEPINETIQVTVSNIDQHGAKLSWTPYQQASRYEISIGTDPEASNRNPFFANQTLAHLPNLIPSTIYHVKVRAVLSGRAGKWSSIITFSTAIPHVQELKIDEVGTSHAKFSWSARYQDLSDIFYDITLSENEQSDPVITKTTNENNLLVSDLLPSKKYYVKIRLRNPLLNGPWSNTYTITTLPDLPKSPPTNLTITNINQREVDVVWDKMRYARTYELSYTIDGQSATVTATTSPNARLQLLPNTLYHFKVRAKTIGDQTQWSSLVSHLTLPEVPDHITVAAQTVDETIIHWQAPAGQKEQLSYHVNWGTNPIASNLGITPTAQTRITLSELAPNEQFNVRVRSVNPSGYSPWSKVLPFATLPKQLSDLSVSDITHHTCIIRWPLVHRATSYELSFGSDLNASHHSEADLKNNQLTLKDLIPDLKYYVKVRPILPNMVYGAWSNIVSFKTFPVPETPKKPQLLDVSSDSIKLSWEPVNNADRYELLISKDRSTIVGRQFIFTDTQETVTPLASNQLYYFKLRALNEGGAGDWSEPHEVTTAPASEPQQVTVSNITPYEAVINWEPISGNGDFSHSIRYAAGKTAWKFIQDVTISNYNLKNLLPNTQYLVQVNTRNISGQTKWSQRINFKTLPAPPEEAPTGLQDIEVTDVGIVCSWNRMPKVSGYIISYGTDMDASNLAELRTERIRYEFKNLVPETGYYLKVKSYNQTGESPWSATQYVYTKTTPPITAPAQVTIINSTDTSITMDWELSYRVLHYEASIGTDPEARNLGEPIVVQDPPYTFNGLKPGSAYFVKVREVNRGGSGPWSRIFRVQTLEDN